MINTLIGASHFASQKSHITRPRVIAALSTFNEQNVKTMNFTLTEYNDRRRMGHPSSTQNFTGSFEYAG